MSTFRNIGEIFKFLLANDNNINLIETGYENVLYVK